MRRNRGERRLWNLACVLMPMWWAGVGWAGEGLAEPEWKEQLGTSGYEEAAGIAASLEGVYVAGYTRGGMEGQTSAGGHDIFLARLEEGGEKRWVRQFGTAGNDYVTGIAVNDVRPSEVALYVVGYTAGGLGGNASAGGMDAYVVRYGAQGERKWVRQWGTGVGDYAQAVATDAAGNVYVAGYTLGAMGGQVSAGGQDLFLASYDAAGGLRWVRQVGTDKNEQARGVAVGADGSVYVAGYTFGGLGGNGNAGASGSDIFLVKYDGEGRRKWVRQEGTDGTDVAQGVATSRRQTGEVEVYVVGRTAGSAGGRGLDGGPQRGSYDMVVLKYDGEGQRKWVRQEGTVGEDTASGVTADGGGNVYVVGAVNVDMVTGAALGSNDVVVLKYDAAGELRARRQLGSTNKVEPSRRSDWGLAVAVDRARGVYVVGYVEGALTGEVAAGDKDAFVAKYPEGCEANTPGRCSIGYGWGRRDGWKSVVAGVAHSLALRMDGTVWAWGRNTRGQLGDGTTRDAVSPVRVQGLDAVEAIVAGDSHSLALRADGTVWAWGYNGHGQLGIGTNIQQTLPVRVSALSGVRAIAAGHHHSLALQSDGTAWAWGDNTFGQLGDGTQSLRLQPVRIQGLEGAVVLAAGRHHSLALCADGRVRAWGHNGQGQLGDGTDSMRLLPSQIPGLEGVSAIAAGTLHSLALRTDGTMWAWGYNGFGGLGDGTVVGRLSPVRVSDLSGVRAIAAGEYHSLAVRMDGTAWAWGFNDHAQVGDGTSARRLLPVQVRHVSDVTRVVGGFAHSLSMGMDGSAWAWGDNASGQLGDGSNTQRLVPVRVADPVVRPATPTASTRVLGGKTSRATAVLER
jgi:alpha-tubulin suppressor-like RCC1 family protein